MTGLVLAMWWWGCSGPNQETLIEELRVVTAIADPPQQVPGQPYTLTATIADPLELGGAWSVWTCIPELEEGTLPPDSLEGPLPEPGCISFDGELSEEEEVQATLPALPFPVFVMACHLEACDLPDITEAQRQDPFAWLQELPLSGVALGQTFPRLLDPSVPSDDRPQNPVIEASYFDGEPVTTEEEVRLSFLVPGAERAYGYTTAGGFVMTDYDVGRDGNTQLIWIAPEEAGTARLYVVFQDGEGGRAIWVADVQVE